MANKNYSYIFCITVCNNLQVVTVTLLGGPAPTLVCTLSCSTYTVSGDNPSTVPINVFNVLLPKLLITVTLNVMEYCVMMPLGVSGGNHRNVTEFELTEIVSKDRGSVGTKYELIVSVVMVYNITYYMYTLLS